MVHVALVFYLLLQALLSHCVTGNLFSGDLPLKPALLFSFTTVS